MRPLSTIQYSAIADRAIEIIGAAPELAPNGKPMAFDIDLYPDAFSVMSVESETVPKTGEVRYTDQQIVRELGRVAGNALLDVIEQTLTPREITWLQTDGVDLNHPDVLTLVDALSVDQQSEVSKLLTYSRLKWPSLRPGEIQNALQWREAGVL